MTSMTPVDNTPRWVANAASYDTWFDQPWGAYASTVEHHLLLDAVPSLDGLRVCDAGCGTGRFAARLEAVGARVTGVDRDPAALAIARTRFTDAVIDHVMNAADSALRSPDVIRPISVLRL